MILDRAMLLRLRALAIALVNLCDDALGLPRTIGDRAARRRRQADA